MKKTILSIILAAATLTATAQNKLIRVAEKPASWKKGKPKKTLFDSEMARLLMPQEAAFGVECIPSFSPEWTLTYDSVARSFVYREAQTSIWHTTFQATHKKKKIGEKRYKWVPRKRPKGYVAPEVKTFTMAVSDDQTAMLRAVWKTSCASSSVSPQPASIAAAVQKSSFFIFNGFNYVFAGIVTKIFGNGKGKSLFFPYLLFAFPNFFVPLHRRWRRPHS